MQYYEIKLKNSFFLRIKIALVNLQVQYYEIKLKNSFFLRIKIALLFLLPDMCDDVVLRDICWIVYPSWLVISLSIGLTASALCSLKDIFAVGGVVNRGRAF